MAADPLDYDPFEGDPLLGEDDRPEPSEALRIAILALAGASMDEYAAAPLPRNGEGRPPPHVAEPHGPRQRKKKARRALFDGLRRGLSPAVACQRAGVSPETFADWCERPQFAEAVQRAQRLDVDAWTPRIGE